MCVFRGAPLDSAGAKRHPGSLRRGPAPARSLVQEAWPGLEKAVGWNKPDLNLSLTHLLPELYLHRLRVNKVAKSLERLNEIQAASSLIPKPSIFSLGCTTSGAKGDVEGKMFCL